jgi:hypothetical protein
MHLGWKISIYSENAICKLENANGYVQVLIHGSVF